jgi:hypothetical protein
MQERQPEPYHQGASKSLVNRRAQPAPHQAPLTTTNLSSIKAHLTKPNLHQKPANPRMQPNLPPTTHELKTRRIEIENPPKRPRL